MWLTLTVFSTQTYKNNSKLRMAFFTGIGHFCLSVGSQYRKRFCLNVLLNLMFIALSYSTYTHAAC